MPCLGIVEDQRGLVNAYRRALKRRAPELDVWSATTFSEAKSQIAARKTDALVLDIGLPDATFDDVKRWLVHLRAHDPLLRIFIVSASKNDALVNLTHALHADRILKEGNNGAYLVDAVADFAVDVAEHARTSSSALARAVADFSNEARLTPREREVVRAAIEQPHEKCEGLAAVVGCRPGTVRKHLENIRAISPASPRSLDGLRVRVLARSRGGR